MRFDNIKNILVIQYLLLHLIEINRGIDNIVKYKNKYVGNNSNDGNLIGNLSLSE